MKQEIQTTKSPTPIGAFQGSRALMFNTLTEIHNFATMVCKTDLAPKAYKGKPEDATIAIIYGMEIGLPPMASLQNIAVVNGSPSVYGDGQLSLVQASGKYEWHKSSYKGTFPNDDFTAIFEVKRVGATESVVKEYSVADAKRAGLWGKAGTWTTNPKLMILYKPKSYALREAFADVLKGMKSNEELEGEEMVEVNPRPLSGSKTANAHIPPASLQQAFSPKPDLNFEAEEIQLPFPAREPIQTGIEDFISEESEIKKEKEIDRIFNSHEAAIKSYMNEKSLSAHFNYLETINDMKFLQDNADSLWVQINYLKDQQMKKIKGE